MTAMPGGGGGGGGGGGVGGRHVVDAQAGVGANPGPELVLAWVDNTFHNLRQRKVIHHSSILDLQKTERQKEKKTERQKDKKTKRQN